MDICGKATKKRTWRHGTNKVYEWMDQQRAAFPKPMTKAQLQARHVELQRQAKLIAQGMGIAAAKKEQRAKHQSEASLLLEIHLKELFLPTEIYRECPVTPERKWRWDFAVLTFGDRLGIELEGGIWVTGRHVRGKGFQNDLEKYNHATAIGWLIFRFSTADVLTGKDIECLKVWMEHRK